METPLAAPTNVNLSGNTLTWDAVSGAAGYLIFMNGNYAGQTTDTTVTLTNTDEKQYLYSENCKPVRYSKRIKTN